MPRSLRYAASSAIAVIALLIGVSLPARALPGYLAFAPIEISAYALAARGKIKVGLIALTAAALLEGYAIASSC
ncbi:MAG: hypothetical protein ACP5MH_10340 [Thermoproteus sp.]